MKYDIHKGDTLLIVTGELQNALKLVSGQPSLKKKVFDRYGFDGFKSHYSIIDAHKEVDQCGAFTFYFGSQLYTIRSTP